MVPIIWPPSMLLYALLYLFMGYYHRHLWPYKVIIQFTHVYGSVLHVHVSMREDK